MTDDEALLIGIQEQNRKYNKLLAFVKELANYAHPKYIAEIQPIGIEAKELLKEIGEDE